MLILEIHPNSPLSIFQQIVGQLVRMIEAGQLKKGERLPATRELAKKLGINRSTVVRAYEELWALGYVESQMGGYTYVRERKQIVKRHSFDEQSAFPATAVFCRGNKMKDLNAEKYTSMQEERDEGFVDMRMLEPDYRLIDRNKFKTITRELLSDKTINPFSYSSPLGYEPLRKALLKQMQLHQVHAQLDNIMISNGTQHSLHLIFQAYTKPGDCIAIESPSYSMIIPLLRYYKLDVVDVPVLDDGPDLEQFKKEVKQRKIHLFYTMPTFQNPTGVTMPQQKREELLDICYANGVVIIEDSIEEEMKFFDKVHLPIKSMDRKGMVIYLGSFAKVLAPGMRVSWIVAHPLAIQQLSGLHRIFDLSGNTFIQMVMQRFLEGGHYERHLRKLTRAFRSRMELSFELLKSLSEPKLIRWKEPLGGYLIWVQLLTRQLPQDPESYFKEFGVRVSDGRKFFFTPVSRSYVRLSIAKCNEEEIREGLESFAKAVGQLA